MVLEIRPLHLGTLVVDKSGLTLRKGFCEKVEAPCLGWLILGGTKPIVVDTGPSVDEGWGARYHNPLQRDASQHLESQLAKHGLSVGDIGYVVLTHLHWDHCYGNASFASTPFYVQKTELDYAARPLPCDAPIYETDLAAPPFEIGRERYRVVDGVADLEDGIRLVPLPGHSPGLQGVLVSTRRGPTMIASDHLPLYENFERNIPTGIVHNLPDWYRATETVRANAEYILPGHDIRVLDQARY